MTTAWVFFAFIYLLCMARLITMHRKTVDDNVMFFLFVSLTASYFICDYFQWFQEPLFITLFVWSVGVALYLSKKSTLSDAVKLALAAGLFWGVLSSPAARLLFDDAPEQGTVFSENIVTIIAFLPASVFLLIVAILPYPLEWSFVFTPPACMGILYLVVRKYEQNETFQKSVKSLLERFHLENLEW